MAAERKQTSGASPFTMQNKATTAEPIVVANFSASVKIATTTKQSLTAAAYVQSCQAACVKEPTVVAFSSLSVRVTMLLPGQISHLSLHFRLQYTMKGAYNSLLYTQIGWSYTL